MFLANFKKIFVVLLCVILIAGVGVFVFNMKADDETIEKPKTKIIFSVADEDIFSVDVKNPEGKFSIERCEDVYKLEGGEEFTEVVYRVYKNHDITLSQSKIKKLLSEFYQFHVLETVSKKSKEADLEKFGFSEDSALIHINTTDGLTHTFTIGGISPDGKTRYVKKSGDNNIYSMNRLKEESFLRNLEFYRERRLENIDINTILSISITDKGERKMGIRFRNENDQEVVTTEDMTYVMILPYTGAVNEEKFGELISEFYQIKVEDFVENDAEDLSVYGLNTESAIRVVIQDIDRHVHRLMFGKADEKGNIYTIYGDNKVVFTTAPNMYNAVLDLNPAEYVEKHTNIFYLEDVANVTLKGTEKIYSLDINKENYQKNYKINDKDAHKGGFETIYQAIISIMITDQAEEEKKEKEILDITFTLNDGSKETSKFYEYDSKNYGVLTTDGEYGLVTNSAIDNLLEVLEIFDKKPSVAP